MNTFLIDGFPRNQENFDGWIKIEKKFDLKFVLVLNCSESECIKRVIERSECESKRLDDNIESLMKRFDSHNKDTVPIIKYFQELNLAKIIDTTNSSISEVFNEIEKIFESTVKI